MSARSWGRSLLPAGKDREDGCQRDGLISSFIYVLSQICSLLLATIDEGGGFGSLT